MVAPAVALLIASAVAAAAKAGSDYYSSKKAKQSGKSRAKETKRETHAGMLENALQRSSELESQRLAGSRKLGKRKAQSSNDTAALVRGALKL